MEPQILQFREIFLKEMEPVLLPVFPPDHYKILNTFTIIVQQNKLVHTSLSLSHSHFSQCARFTPGFGQKSSVFIKGFLPFRLQEG
jgi:hypothetical protein